MSAELTGSLASSRYLPTPSHTSSGPPLCGSLLAQPATQALQLHSHAQPARLLLSPLELSACFDQLIGLPPTTFQSVEESPCLWWQRHGKREGSSSERISRGSSQHNRGSSSQRSKEAAMQEAAAQEAVKSAAGAAQEVASRQHGRQESAGDPCLLLQLPLLLHQRRCLLLHLLPIDSCHFQLQHLLFQCVGKQVQLTLLTQQCSTALLTEGLWRQLITRGVWH